jgi:hypothetical protein
VRYGLSVLLLEVFGTPGLDSICRQVQRQLMGVSHLLHETLLGVRSVLFLVES